VTLIQGATQTAGLQRAVSFDASRVFGLDSVSEYSASGSDTPWTLWWGLPGDL